MLTSALYTSFAGLNNTEAKISVTSDNVTNADKPGYTRKEYDTDYSATIGRTLPSSGTITTINYNDFLFEELVEDTSIAARDALLAEYLTTYANEFGTLGGDSTASAYLNDIISNFDRLSINPEDESLKSQVVLSSKRLASELNRLSASTQDARLRADEEIESLVTEINAHVELIEELNSAIISTSLSGGSTANLEDDRRVQIEELSRLIDMDYFINSNNEVQIYTQGRPLLDSRAHTITYTANTALDKTTLYPGGFNSINLDGFDLTAAVSDGELGALIQIRDDYMVEEQAKLDEFANVLSDQLNALLNQGASMQPRSDIIGDTASLTGGTALGATGTIRIATLDSTGVVQNSADINLTALTDVNDLITAINTALSPDVSASLTADGELRLVAANTGEGVALNQMTSSFTPSGDSFSQFFGLNNLFSGDGADTIQVSDFLLADPASLATANISSGAIATGDTILFEGDSSLTQSIISAFETDFSYNAAGNFAAQTDTIDNYIDKIIADAALRANSAMTDAKIGETLVNQTKTTLANLSAVNIDEEMTNLIDLEAKYEASATMIATLQAMFDTLLASVR